jgi:hypothetical protein
MQVAIVFTIVFAPPANLPRGNSIVFAPLALLRSIMASLTLGGAIIILILGLIFLRTNTMLDGITERSMLLRKHGGSFQ